jgi:hypothetical protein
LKRTVLPRNYGYPRHPRAVILLLLVAGVFEHDKLLMQEQEKDNLALELRILHERLTNAYRRLVLIASHENVSARDRIDVDAASCEVAVAIAKLAFEGPIILKDFGAYTCADDPSDSGIDK